MPNTSKCKICAESYETKKEARECESKKVTQDKKVKRGDLVKITTGDGAGELVTVVGVGILSKYWGHYNWKRYWHTVYVTADLKNKFSRILTFDSYEIPKVNSRGVIE